MPMERQQADTSGGIRGYTLSDLEKIKKIAKHVAAEIIRLGLTEFDVECGNGDTLLISRAGHVHATWNAVAGRLCYTQAGYGAPTFTTLDVEQAVKHTMRMLAQTKST
jgi:hypothetical protein